jgi:hypothetical protein
MPWAESPQGAVPGAGGSRAEEELEERNRKKETGGESGIRTHGRFPYTRFPSVRLQPLGHLSGNFGLAPRSFHPVLGPIGPLVDKYPVRGRWRRGRDSNPRTVARYTLSRGAPSATRPPLRGGRNIRFNARIPHPVAHCPMGNPSVGASSSSFSLLIGSTEPIHRHRPAPYVRGPSRTRIRT